MTNNNQTPSTWWGSANLAAEKSRQWRIGPLTVIVRYLNNECQVAYEHSNDAIGDNTVWDIADSDRLPDSLANKARYISNEDAGLVSITPCLADRPVISRPQTPFHILAGESVTLYVSSPLWLNVSTGTTKKILTEIPIQRPSDTWFGSSTREGELCYASTTHCRLNLEELPHRPHRAITPVLILNQANTTLSVDRLNLPTELLPLYACSDGQLWTPRITLIREKDGDMAALKIDNQPPHEANAAVQLCQPRKTTSNGALFRAFSAILS